MAWLVYSVGTYSIMRYLTMQEYLTETLGILTYSLYIILYNIYLIWFFSTVKTISRVDNASYLWPACSTVRVMETPSGGSLLSYRMNNFKTATNWIKTSLCEWLVARLIWSVNRVFHWDNNKTINTKPFISSIIEK